MPTLTIKQAAKKVFVRAEDIRAAIAAGELEATFDLDRGQVVSEIALIWWADNRPSESEDDSDDSTA